MATPEWLTYELYMQLDLWLIRAPLLFAAFVAVPFSWAMKKFAKDRSACVSEYRYKEGVPLWLKRLHSLIEGAAVTWMGVMFIYAVIFHWAFAAAVSGGKPF